METIYITALVILGIVAFCLMAGLTLRLYSIVYNIADDEAHILITVLWIVFLPALIGIVLASRICGRNANGDIRKLDIKKIKISSFEDYKVLKNLTDAYEVENNIG